MNLTTTYQYDSQGRTTEATDPDGHVTYTVYNDTYASNSSLDLQGIRNEIRTYSGWSIVNGSGASATSNVTLTDPTHLTATSASAYVGWTLLINSGTDANSTAAITQYNPSTHTLTFSPAMPSNVDATSVYVLAGGTGPTQVSREYLPGTAIVVGQASAAGTTTTLTDTSNLLSGGNYTGLELVITGGDADVGLGRRSSPTTPPPRR